MRRKQWIIVAVLLVVLLILLVSNPSRDHHMSTIRERQRSLVGAGLTIAGEALGAFEYHNYFLLSTVSSGEDVISVGMLGMVWVDEDDR